MAVNQTPISVRVNNRILQALNDYCEENNLRRNAVINESIAKYIGFEN